MRIVASRHWARKRRYRPGITDELIRLALRVGRETRDPHGEGVYSVVARVPGTARVLKVVYRRMARQTFKVITAYWVR